MNLLKLSRILFAVWTDLHRRGVTRDYAFGFAPSWRHEFQELGTVASQTFARLGRTYPNFMGTELIELVHFRRTFEEQF